MQTDCNHVRTSTSQTVENCQMEINTYSGHHSIDFLQRKEKRSLVISYQTNQCFLTERKIPLYLRNERQETCFEAASSISQLPACHKASSALTTCIAIGMGVWHLCEEAKLIHGISLTFRITLKKTPVILKKEEKKKKGKSSRWCNLHYFKRNSSKVTL